MIVRHTDPALFSFLEDARKYPYYTLSQERRNVKMHLEENARKILSVKSLGKGKLPTPYQILEYWYKKEFPSHDSFLCCPNPGEKLSELTSLLADPPFFCLSVACMSMNNEKKTTNLQHIRGVIDDVIKVDANTKKRKKTTLLETNSPADRTQSVINISSDPVEWILHKNRRLVSHVLRNMTERNKSITMKDITDGPDKFDRVGKVSDDILDRLFSKNQTDNKTTELDNQERKENKKKMKSSWRIIAYVILDRTFNPKFIKNIKTDVFKSKGLANRIMKLSEIARKHRLPFWITKDVVDETDLRIKEITKYNAT